MQYRQFGNLEWKPSALGFGIMRLPTIGDDYSKIDEEKAARMIRYGIDQGINYIDTAWSYHEGNSEPFLGNVLKDGYRDKVKLATKLTLNIAKEQESLDSYLNQQLDNLQTDYIDFYLVHTLDQKRWEKVQDEKILHWLKKIKSEGKVKHLGFSFHDDLELFKKIIESFNEWTFCQIQYNYVDTEFQAGREGLRYAASKGLGVVIMEPLMGGKLAAEPPSPIKAILNDSQKSRSPVEWAFEWLWSHPEVSLVLSGMSTLDQVKEDVQIAAMRGSGSLTAEEMRLVEAAGSKYKELCPVNCTGCNYCMPCPNGVWIPSNLRLYNDAVVYERFEDNAKQYSQMDKVSRASACVSCGECVDKCPQNIAIPERLAEIADYFGQANERF